MIDYFLNAFPHNLENEGKGQGRLLAESAKSLKPSSRSGVQIHCTNCLLVTSTGYSTNHLKTDVSKYSPFFFFSRPPAPRERCHFLPDTPPCPKMVVTQTSPFLLASIINLLISRHASEHVESSVSLCPTSTSFLQPFIHYFLWETSP